MKKLQKGFAVFALSMFMMSMANTTTLEKEDLLIKKSCFEWARGVVIAIDGEINLENVHAVNYLTAVCEGGIY